MSSAIKLAAPVVVTLLLFSAARAEDKPGYIGVQIHKTDDGKGALVKVVLDDSPAAKAGLKADDLIIKIDGKEFATLEEFVKRIRAFKPGDKLTLTIKRDGKEKEIKVTAGAPPDMPG